MAKKKFKNKKQVNFSQGGSGGVTESEMKDDFREEGTNHKFKNKKGKNKKKYEKQNRSKKNNEKFVLKKGILNTLTTLDDDDTDMHGSGMIKNLSMDGAGAPRVSKSAKQRLKSMVLGQSATDRVEGWHKMSIMVEPALGKPGVSPNLVLQAIAMSLSSSVIAGEPINFRPFNAQVEKQRELTFIVQRFAVAKAIKDNLNGKSLQLPSSGNLVSFHVKTKPNSAPTVHINDSTLEAIKRVCGSRYRAETRALDLRDFNSDPGLVIPASGTGEATGLCGWVYAPLSRTSVMEAVVNIIGDNIPEVVAIDFSNNGLPTLAQFSALAEKATSLKVIYLTNNKLSDISELKKLKYLRGLTELKLSGNKMQRKFNTQEGFEHAVQSIFPSLRVLDDKALPKLITFDEGDEEDRGGAGPELPASVKKMCLGAGAQAAEGVILQFIQQYFQIYDSDDREPLGAAYHQDALFSLTCSYPPGSASHGSKSLDSYVPHSRNLNKITSASRRLRLLKQGSQEITSFICYDLPKTSHDLDSFNLDVPLATPAMVSLTLTGSFLERTSRPSVASSTSSTSKSVKHFARTFNLVPAGSGVVIVNETLHVTLATKCQADSAFQSAAKTQSEGKPESSLLIAQVVEKTRMKPEWAQKCLEQTKWDVQQALQAFETAKSGGLIPPDAFQ